MAEVLLQELSNADIDWMIAVGRQQQLTAGTVLLRPCTSPDEISVLLDGTLAIATPATPAAAGNGHASSDGGCPERELAHLSRGELVGETALFNARPLPALIKAIDNVVILTIPLSQLALKVQQDIQFGTHLYRAIALLLSDRIRQLLDNVGNGSSMRRTGEKDALLVFSEMRDSDTDWLISVGQVQTLAPGKVLFHAGRPTDALYIILDGVMSVLVPDSNSNPLALCFGTLERNAAAYQEISRLSRGETGGTISFLEFRPQPVTLRAVQESVVLVVPRQQLMAKLQHDMGFASRFYRVLVIQLLNILRSAMSEMGCAQQTHDDDQPMDDTTEFEDEINLESLQHMSQGAARFNWMLKRLGIM
jgi:bacteriocin-type transport-associated protein